MVNYLCKRCNYKTNKFCDIKKHIYKAKICDKDPRLYAYSNDQLFIASLLPCDEDTIFDINNFKNIKNLLKNKEILFSILYEIDKKKNKICKYCSEEFNKVQDLKNHIIIQCFPNEIMKMNEIESKEFILKNSCDNTEHSHNTTTTTTTTENSHNVTLNLTNNITLNITRPVGFNEDWDLSKINKSDKELLLFSKIMYTKLLEQIMENELNLNVIIDKETNTGIVYSKDKENDKTSDYIKMDFEDIVKKSMEKLNKNLIDILNDAKSSDIYENDFLNKSENNINVKLKNFLKNKDTQDKVEDYMTKVFESKKESAIKIMKDINSDDSDKIDKLGGY